MAGFLTFELNIPPLFIGAEKWIEPPIWWLHQTGSHVQSGGLTVPEWKGFEACRQKWHNWRRTEP